MKSDPTSENDAPLREMLRKWTVDAALPPRFQEQVWQRIERTATPPAPSISLGDAFANWVATVLPRPALAAAYVMVLLAIGAAGGWMQARHETSRVGDELGARYVRAVDPYQAGR
ncbi:MAG: hypothetical protein HY300_06265 [Verrucomicrobia bacterium]|nr:hypothetical protein [Verrucomicrobiota bacterium]